MKRSAFNPFATDWVQKPDCLAPFLPVWLHTLVLFEEDRIVACPHEDMVLIIFNPRSKFGDCADDVGDRIGPLLVAKILEVLFC